MSQSRKKKQRELSNNTALIVAFSLVALLLILVIAFILHLMFGGNKDPKPSAPETSSEATAASTEAPGESTGAESTEEESPEASGRSTESAEGSAAESTGTPSLFPYDLGDGIILTAFNNYAGLYVEDGTDEIVSNIPLVVLENRGETAVELLRVFLTNAKGERYEFEAMTLLPGQRMSVLEKHRKAYDAAEIISAECTQMMPFSEKPSMHTDTLMLIVNDNTLTVRNISDKTVKNARVYYKNLSGDLLVGGITYSLSVPELAPGASISLTPGHFRDGSSRVLFTTYEQ